MSKQKQLSLVRVNVTGQPYDYFRPWQKKAPFSKARAWARFFRKAAFWSRPTWWRTRITWNWSARSPAKKRAANVVVIDYEANLALLEPTEKKFLDGLTPLEIAIDTVVGDRLAAWQLEPTGALVVTEGLVTTIQMMRYPADVGQFLTYRISIVDAVSRKQLHGSAGQEQQARRVAPALRSALAGPRCDSRADHRAFFERAGKPKLSRLSLGRIFILSDARSATAPVCRAKPANRAAFT